MKEEISKTSESEVEVGRVLRASVTEFVVGCRATETGIPSFGGLVRVSLANHYHVYGLIYDIHIEDDGLVRQLVTLNNVEEQVIADNRLNRNVPLEFSVLTVGYKQDGQLSHLLPPRPPLSMDKIYSCSNDELRQFSSFGRFGYFRHVLQAKEIPTSELLAAHIQQATFAHIQVGNAEWANRATKELITLLRDDYPALMSLLSALNDISPGK